MILKCAKCGEEHKLVTRCINCGPGNGQNMYEVVPCPAGHPTAPRVCMACSKEQIDRACFAGAAEIKSLQDELSGTIEEAAAFPEALQLAHREIFALKDGLRGWQEIAKKTQEALDEAKAFRQAVQDLEWEITHLDNDICGTIAERALETVKRLSAENKKLKAELLSELQARTTASRL